MRLLVALLAMALVSAGTRATELVGTPRIVDGDTLAIGTTKIRLVGIDAPETERVYLNAQAKRWSCDIEARDRLSAHIADREIRCVSAEIDVTRRELARYNHSPATSEDKTE